MAINFRTTVNIPISLGGLASSATLISGRQADEYDNSTNKDPGGHLSGRIKVGTSPTGGQISLFILSRLDDTPTYPDQMGGTDAARSFTSANVLMGSAKQIWSVSCDTTTGRNYDFDLLDPSMFCGGILPAYFTLYLAHSSGVSLDATNSNHFIKFKPYYFS